jgi:hypothetical protein
MSWLFLLELLLINKISSEELPEKEKLFPSDFSLGGQEVYLFACYCYGQKFITAYIPVTVQR